ncbi:MAG TPA: peptidyl-prolyl cis-trans isomerase [Candidatus Brocadiia bacterium]|nr:peptidyl-prolyl cis-trans isomerase [Candidatus Brocadiia bacterium]
MKHLRSFFAYIVLIVISARVCAAQTAAETQPAPAPDAAEKAPAAGKVPDGAWDPKTDFRKPIPDVVLRVNGQDVTRVQYGEALTDYMGARAVDDIIRRMLAAREFEKAGIEIPEEDVRQGINEETEFRYKAMLRDYRVSDADFKASLKAGKTIEDVMARIRSTVSPRSVELRLSAVKLLQEKVTVSDEEIRKRYDERYGELIIAKQIVVKTEEDAKEIKKQLDQHPERFTDYATKYSMDRAGSERQGRMNPLPAASSMGDVLKNAPPDKIILHHTEIGWHVMKKDRIEPADPRPFEELKPIIREEVFREKMDNCIQEWLLSLQDTATVLHALGTDKTAAALLPPDAILMVGGQSVTREQFGNILIQEFGSELIDAMIDRVLIDQQARKEDVTASDQEVNQRIKDAARVKIENKARDQGMTYAEFLDKIEKNGMSPEELETQVIIQTICRGDVISTIQAEKIVGKEVVISDEEVQRFYQRNFGEKVELLRITARTRNDAFRLKKMVEQGADFANTARSESVDLSAPKGGQMPPVSADWDNWEAVKDLKIGEVSKVFTTEEGHCFVKVMKRSIPEDAKPYEEIKERIREVLKEERIRNRIEAWLKVLRESAKVERFI